MARMAVGAVNMEEAPCSERTRKKAPGSGVPTGLPWKHTERDSHVIAQTAKSKEHHEIKNNNNNNIALVIFRMSVFQYSLFMLGSNSRV